MLLLLKTKTEGEMAKCTYNLRKKISHAKNMLREKKREKEQRKEHAMKKKEDAKEKET